MSDFLRRFARQFAELNKDNLQRLDELYTDDVHFTDPLHEVQGLGAFAQLLQRALRQRQRAALRLSRLRPDRRRRRLSALGHELPPSAPGGRPVDSGRRLLAPALARQGLSPPGLLRCRGTALRTSTRIGPGDCLAEKENGMSLTPPRRYWLTGASSGIGAALAEEILKTGAHLAVSSRSVAPLKVLSQRYPGQVLVVAGRPDQQPDRARNRRADRARTGARWIR